jgi:hypothetical protein
MAFTAAQLAAIEEAIASGVLEVKYSDRTVKYNSLGDLMDLRNQMIEELDATASKVSYARHRRYS